MRELESSLQSFGEYLLRARLVRSTAAPYFVRWVRRLRGVNYYCRLATTISAGEESAKECRPPPAALGCCRPVGGRVEGCRVIRSLIKNPRMAVGARGKPSAVFQGPVGAFCASTGPAASTASSGRGDRRTRVGAANPVESQVVRRGDRRSWGILSGRFCHEASSGRGGGPFPRRFACSVRKLGTSNSSSTE